MPFDALINVVYVVNGYIGFGLLFLMLVKDFKTRVLKRSSKPYKQKSLIFTLNLTGDRLRRCWTSQSIFAYVKLKLRSSQHRRPDLC
ncbi:hypothetical protein [Pseudomonas asiatica]|uniref:hypothetical protein n=1 Tax=Pseudomonas asiatica TaxID=2219225 RepID=UPI0020167D19|nr:hypothetical protein [Pseudomonas asiatica]